MLIIWKIVKKLNCSNINVKYYVVVCVPIYTIKYNMQHLNNNFNKFKMDGSFHVKMLMVQKMWKNCQTIQK